MDRLTAFVAIAHLRLRLTIAEKYPHLLETEIMATPKLQGLTKAIDQLEHDLEFGAGKLLDKITSVGNRGADAFVKGHAKVDGIAGRVAEIETFVAAVEKSTNGGDPLDGSSNSSEPPVAPKPPETPAGAGQAVAPVTPDQPPAPAPVAAQPEELTVNGVSKS
jgi:hypothetical protein